MERQEAERWRRGEAKRRRGGCARMVVLTGEIGARDWHGAVLSPLDHQWVRSLILGDGEEHPLPASHRDGEDLQDTNVRLSLASQQPLEMSLPKVEPSSKAHSIMTDRCPLRVRQHRCRTRELAATVIGMICEAQRRHMNRKQYI